jgi:hypothetical protein
MDETADPDFSVASPRHPKSPWTAERLERLRARWSQGVTAAAIARELGAGISRCAVLAKVHRLGIAQLSPASRGRQRFRPKSIRIAPTGIGPVANADKPAAGERRNKRSVQR